MPSVHWPIRPTYTTFGLRVQKGGTDFSKASELRRRPGTIGPSLIKFYTKGTRRLLDP